MISDGPVIRLGFEERLRRLRHLGAEGHPRDVDVAVHVRQQAEILLADRLAGRRELRGGAERRRLRRLAAGVRVDLGVHDQDVDVAPVGEHVIEAAVADVVGPPVAADQPHALLHQVVGERVRAGVASALASGASWRPQRDDALALGGDAGFVRLIGVEQRASPGRSPICGARCWTQVPRAAPTCASSAMPQAEAELRVVLEQRVRPRRPAAVAVGRVRRRRQVAAVDRRAAGRVGDQQAVAEQLRQQLEVRRLAAAGARARVLEQRLEELRALVIDLGQSPCDRAREG